MHGKLSSFLVCFGLRSTLYTKAAFAYSCEAVCSSVGGIFDTLSCLCGVFLGNHVQTGSYCSLTSSLSRTGSTFASTVWLVVCVISIYYCRVALWVSRDSLDILLHIGFYSSILPFTLICVAKM